MKKCSVCGIEKPVSEFSKSYPKRCKECVAEHTREVRRWNEYEQWHECADDTEDVPKLNTTCLLRIEYKEIDTDIVEIGYLTAVWGDYGWYEDYLDNFDRSEYEVKITHWKPIGKPKGVEK